MTEARRYRHRSSLAVATVRSAGRSGVLVSFTDETRALRFPSAEAADRGLRAREYAPDPEKRARPVNVRVATDLAIGADLEATPVPSPEAREMRELRTSADMSLEAVAQILDLSVRTVIRLEQGRAPMSALYLPALRAAIASGATARRWDPLRGPRGSTETEEKG